jgi:parvulin-like peptidyl-prolyl isomerase
VANGFNVTPEMVETRLSELVEASGGAENFGAWLQANQWTEEEFREALAKEMVTEQMVALVTADVPTTAEQVRASYIQLDDPALAQSLLDQIRAGADFVALAQQHSLDRITGENGGDLGFFSAGTLLVPEVEAAAFALQPGELSEVITVTPADGGSATYYVVLVTERDPQRPLSNELRYSLLQAKFEEWLAELRAQATIERFVDTGS